MSASPPPTSGSSRDFRPHHRCPQEESIPFLVDEDGSGEAGRDLDLDLDRDLELQDLEDHSQDRSLLRPSSLGVVHRTSDPLTDHHRRRRNNSFDHKTRVSSFSDFVYRSASHLYPAFVAIRSCGRRSSRQTPDRSRELKSTRRGSLRGFGRIISVLLMLLGVLQLGTLLLRLGAAFFPEKLDYAFSTWRKQDVLDDQTDWRGDYTADIIPVACHSHNDYWRRVPLKSAITAGCTGVEADVWLFNNDLYVGHSESALTANKTFTSLYVNPLVEILDRHNSVTQFQQSPKYPRNGVFDTDASQTLVLLIDFKTDYETLWPVVKAQLEPLRQKQYLTIFNGTAVISGPITVVVTGNAPFDLVVEDMNHRDMFFDAPLDRLASLADSPPSRTYDPSLELEYLASAANQVSSPNGTLTDDQNNGQGHSGHPPKDPSIFTRANSFYASVNFEASIGWPRPYLSRAQRDKLATQIAGAHAQGLKVRYWGVPNWPIGLRNYLWRELVKLGVDYLNVDDLHAATKGDWRSGHSVWDWSLWGGRDW